MQFLSVHVYDQISNKRYSKRKKVFRVTDAYLCYFNFVVLFFVLKRIYDTLVDPIISKKCDAKFNKTLFEKSMNSDISDFEDPSSYDLFIRAVTNGTGAVNATLNFVNEALDSALKLFF